MNQPQHFDLAIFVAYGIAFATIGAFTVALAWDYHKELRNKR